jgi:hypothetical protein
MEVNGQLHAPFALLPGDRVPGIHLIGDWVSPSVDLDYMEKKKILAHIGIRTPTPRSSNLQPLAIPTALSRLLISIAILHRST